VSLLPALRSAAEPETKAATSSTPFLPQSRQGRPYRDDWDIERAIRDGYKRITWVFRAVHIRATKSAGLPLVMRKDDPETGDEVPHNLLPLLNAYPNDEESAYVFRYRLSAQVDLNRRGAFVEIQRARLGSDAVALRLLPSTTVPVPGTGGAFLDRFEVMLEGRKVKELAPSDVVWVRHPHPTDPYGGMTPLEAAGIAVDSEWLAKLFQRSFMQNNAALGKLVLVAGAENIQELQARFDARSGPAQSGRTVVLEASAMDDDGPTGKLGGVNVIDMSASPREASFIEMRKYTKEEIFGAYGVAISIGVANAADRTFDNAGVEELGFWRHTMIDHCRLLDRPWDRIDGDPSTFLAHDFSSVWVLQRDEVERENHLLEQVKERVLVPDEFRKEVGREPFAQGGDVALASITLYPVASITPDAIGASTSGAKSASADSDLVTWGPFRVDAKRLSSRRAERLRQITSWEKQAKRITVRFFDRQERTVVEKLRGRKAREGTRHWRIDGAEPKVPAIVGGDGTKVIAVDDIFDIDRWNEQLVADLGGVVQSVVEHFGEDAYDAITSAKTAVATETKAEGGFDPSSRAVTQFILNRQNKITGVNDTTYAAIVDALAEGEAAGATIDGLADLVTAVFDQARGYRAETIARTEVVSAANAGAKEGAVQSGVVETQSWLATEDERTRETHAEADGQTVGLDETFTVGDAELAYPGDPDGPPEETIACRCSITFGTDEGPIL
jgi:HK97 family phage portal protein